MALAITLLDPRRHDRAAFGCGVAALDDYLRRHASQHHRDGIATTHVLIDDADPARVLGYCSLAAAQLRLSELQPADRKRLPALPVPAVRVGRLAVATRVQGNGYGTLLLGHAVNSSLALRSQLGIRVLLVDAIDDRAAAFYRAFGLRETVASAKTLYLAFGKG